MKEIVDYEALNRRAGTRAAVLTKLVEAFADLPRVRLAAECLSHFYGRMVEIREELDDEANLVLDKEVQKALSLMQSCRATLISRSMALSNNAETSDMFPETLILMRASGYVINLGHDYDRDSDPNDAIWVPPEGTNPKVLYSVMRGCWECWDQDDPEPTTYTGHSPTAAYVAWRQGREWVAEPDMVPPAIPPMKK